MSSRRRGASKVVSGYDVRVEPGALAPDVGAAYEPGTLRAQLAEARGERTKWAGERANDGFAQDIGGVKRVNIVVPGNVRGGTQFTNPGHAAQHYRHFNAKMTGLNLSDPDTSRLFGAIGLGGANPQQVQGDDLSAVAKDSRLMVETLAGNGALGSMLAAAHKHWVRKIQEGTDEMAQVKIALNASAYADGGFKPLDNGVLFPFSEDAAAARHKNLTHAVTYTAPGSKRPIVLGGKSHLKALRAALKANDLTDISVSMAIEGLGLTALGLTVKNVKTHRYHAMVVPFADAVYQVSQRNLANVNAGHVKAAMGKVGWDKSGELKDYVVRKDNGMLENRDLKLDMRGRDRFGMGNSPAARDERGNYYCGATYMGDNLYNAGAEEAGGFRATLKRHTRADGSGEAYTCAAAGLTAPSNKHYAGLGANKWDKGVRGQTGPIAQGYRDSINSLNRKDVGHTIGASGARGLFHGATYRRAAKTEAMNDLSARRPARRAGAPVRDSDAPVRRSRSSSGAEMGSGRSDEDVSVAGFFDEAEEGPASLGGRRRGRRTARRYGPW